MERCFGRTRLRYVKSENRFHQNKKMKEVATTIDGDYVYTLDVTGKVKKIKCKNSDMTFHNMKKKIPEHKMWINVHDNYIDFCCHVEGNLVSPVSPMSPKRILMEDLHTYAFFICEAIQCVHWAHYIVGFVKMDNKCGENGINPKVAWALCSATEWKKIACNDRFSYDNRISKILANAKNGEHNFAN